MFIPREIFRFESGSSETWLTANADGTLTDTRENSGWRCLHRGIEPDECVISPAEAIRRWPQHAEAIQAAAQDALPPLHAIPVIGVDGVCLRVYRGPRLECEIPLRRRQALVLAAQLLNQALMPEYHVGPDSSMLETKMQQRVADGAGKSPHG